MTTFLLFLLTLPSSFSRPCSEYLNFDKNNFYWNYPSDHLPVVGKVTLKSTQETFNIVTWNVLNPNYLGYILTPQDTQGLKSSAITESQNRLQKIFEIFRHLIRDVDPALVALQEVHPALLSQLKEWAAISDFTLLFTANPNTKSGKDPIDHGVILVNNRHVTLTDEPVEIIPFFSDKGTPTKYIKRVS